MGRKCLQGRSKAAVRSLRIKVICRRIKVICRSAGSLGICTARPCPPKAILIPLDALISKMALGRRTQRRSRCLSALLQAGVLSRPDTAGSLPLWCKATCAKQGSEMPAALVCRAASSRMRGRLPVTLNPGGQCVRCSCKDENELIVFEIAHLTKNFLLFREKSCDLFTFLSIICYRLSLASSP